MSDAPDAPVWVWQGFVGPMDAAIAAKAVSDAAPAERLGVRVPLPGLPPVAATPSLGMFAVQSRPDDPWPVPEGMEEAQPAIVGRLVGA